MKTLIDAIFIICTMVVSFAVLRYFRGALEGAERFLAYMLFISICYVGLPRLHALVHRRSKDQSKDS